MSGTSNDCSRNISATTTRTELISDLANKRPAAEPLPALVTSQLGHDSEACTTATTARLERGGAEGTSSTSLREVVAFGNRMPARGRSTCAMRNQYAPRPENFGNHDLSRCF